MILKAIHEIVLKDVILLDATKSPRSLKKYPFLPVSQKELEKLTKEIFDLIGGKTIDNIQDEFDKLLSYRRLQLLDTLRKAVMIETSLKSRINAWKILLEKDPGESSQLQKVLDEVKNHTGIEIKEPKDLKEFEDYVTHKIDKYAELYPPDEVPTEGEKLTKILYSVFKYLDEPYNEQMRLITFVELKAMAEDRIKQSKTTTENGQE
jgi:hypothetical protein